MIEYDADGVWLIGDMSLCDIIASVSCVSPTCVDDMKDELVEAAEKELKKAFKGWKTK